jgi:hypothetical protein
VTADDATTVTVVAAGGGDGAGGPGGSPFTGAASGRWILVAALSLALGTSLVAGTRRPRPRRSS